MNIHLMTAASLTRARGTSQYDPVRLEIRVGRMDAQLRFPRPGRNTKHTIGFPSVSRFRPFGDESEKQVAIDVDAELVFPDMSRLGFGYRHVGQNDILTLVQIRPDKFLAEMTHEFIVKGCRAVCEDGTEGQPCVVCTKNGISVRICC